MKRRPYNSDSRRDDTVMPFKDIAKAMGLPINTVYGIYIRAMIKMRRLRHVRRTK